MLQKEHSPKKVSHALNENYVLALYCTQVDFLVQPSSIIFQFPT